MGAGGDAGPGCPGMAGTTGAEAPGVVGALPMGLPQLVQKAAPSATR